MNKIDYHSLTKEQKEKVKDDKTQASHRALTSMRQAEVHQILSCSQSSSKAIL